MERQIFLSSLGPIETFSNHFLRPAGAPLARPDGRYVPLGGAGLRGYSPLSVAGRVASVNVEQDVLLRAFGPVSRPLRVSAAAFGDAALLFPETRAGVVRVTAAEGKRRGVGDAGVALVARGSLYDREVRARVDFPLFLSRPALGVEPVAKDDGGRGAFRVTFSFSDLW